MGEIVLLGLVFVGIFALVLAFGPRIMPGRQPLDRRIASLNGQQKKRGAQPDQTAAIANIKRKSGGIGLLASLFDRLEIMVRKAGVPLPSRTIFIVIVLLFLLMVAVFHLLGWSALLAMLAATAISGAPVLYLKVRATKADALMLKQLPEALDMIVRSIKTGLPVSEAIKVIASSSEPPLATVFADVDDNLRIGRAIDESFSAAIKKFPMPELNFLATSINIQRDTGGNMSEIIANLSDIMRQRERLKSKIRAMSSEARASAMIIGSLPFIMSIIIWFVNPEYIATMWRDPRGHMLAGIGAASMATGSFVIWRMIKFRI